MSQPHGLSPPIAPPIVGGFNSPYLPTAHRFFNAENSQLLDDSSLQGGLTAHTAPPEGGQNSSSVAAAARVLRSATRGLTSGSLLQRAQRALDLTPRTPPPSSSLPPFASSFNTTPSTTHSPSRSSSSPSTSLDRSSSIASSHSESDDVNDVRELAPLPHLRQQLECPASPFLTSHDQDTRIHLAFDCKADRGDSSRSVLRIAAMWESWDKFSVSHKSSSLHSIFIATLCKVVRTSQRATTIIVTGAPTLAPQEFLTITSVIANLSPTAPQPQLAPQLASWKPLFHLLYKKRHLRFRLLETNRLYNGPAVELACAKLANREPLRVELRTLPQVTPLVESPSLLLAATAKRRNTWRSLPSHLLSLWSMLLENLFSQSLSHEVNVTLITVAPVIFLDRSHSPTIESLETNLSQAVASEAFRHACVETFLNGKSNTTAQNPVPRSQPTVVRKAQRLVGIGADRKALDTLSQLLPDSETDYPLNATTRSEVEKLFPPRKAPVTQLPRSAPVVINKNSISSALRKLSRGSAPSFDGWTRELMHPIFASKTYSPKAANALLSVITTVINDTATTHMATFLRTGVLFTLRKQNGKPRPIVISTILTKIAWKILLLQTPVSKLLSSSQITGKYFCHRAIHTVQRSLNEGKSVVLLDAKNAFGEIGRSAIAARIGSTPDLSLLSNIFNLLYLPPTTARHCLPDGAHIDISIEEGVLQGCAAAPSIFTLVLGAALCSLDLDSQRSICAVADDIAIISSNNAHAVTTAQKVSKELLSIGIEVNDDKCVAFFEGSPFNFVRYHDYLGAVVTMDRSLQISIADLRPRYLARLLAFEAYLSTSDYSKQAANLLIRYISFTWFYLACNTLPSIALQLFTSFSAWQETQFKRIVEFDLSATQISQVFLPDQLGGNNLTKWECYSKSVYDITQRFVNQLISADSIAPDVGRHSIYSAFRDLCQKDANSFWENRFTLNNRAPSASQRSDRVPDSARVDAILRAFQESYFHWNAVRPEQKINVLSNRQWQLAMASRLGSSFECPPVCATSKHASPLDHILTCSPCTSSLWKRRHNRILFALTSVLKEHGILSTTDVARYFGRQGDIGPDCLVFGNEKTFAIDVSITHQHAQSHYYRPRQIEHDKERKYKDLGERMNWSIVPLIFTSFGHPTKKTVQWIRSLVKNSNAPGAVKRIIAACTIANLRGHADVVDLASLSNVAPAPPLRS